MRVWVRFSGLAWATLALAGGCSSVETEVAVEPGVCCELDVPHQSFMIDGSGVPEFLRPYVAEELAAVLRGKGLVETEAADTAETADLIVVLRFERGALGGANPITITVDPGEQVQTPRAQNDRDSMQRSLGSDTPRHFMARLVMEMRAASTGELVWSGVLTRVHSVTPGDYMHERARVPINLAFQRLLEDFPPVSSAAQPAE